MNKSKKVVTGCCGFRTSMQQYMQAFTAVEVQHTFYNPPQIATLERWRNEAPHDFEFTLKAWQLITHSYNSRTYKRLRRDLSEEQKQECGAFQSTKIVKEAWSTTAACTKALKATRILFQCPASFTPTTEHVKNMRRFFTSIDKPKGWKLMWEPRGDWPQTMIKELCSELDLIHVVDPFANRTVTPKQCYFRLHGRKTGRYSYEDGELEELLGLLPLDSNSYVFFNNLYMKEDATRFQQLLKENNRI